jgi:transcriptional regulator with XRE-family HTH domain
MTRQELEDLARKKVSHKIRIALAHKNWKAKDLAHVLDVSPSSVTRWLSGKHNFTVDTLVGIQWALDIKLLDVEIPKI